MHFVKIGNEGVNLDLVATWKMDKAIKCRTGHMLTFEEAEEQGLTEDRLCLRFLSENGTTFEVRGDEARALYNHLYVISRVHIVAEGEASEAQGIAIQLMQRQGQESKP